MRPDGFGIQLRRIVQTYQHPSHPPQAHVALFVPFTLDPKRTLNIEALQARRLFADVRTFKCPLNGPLGDSLTTELESPEGVALSALALSIMRAEMAKECHARVVLGGGLRKFAGIYPGIAEEAFEAVRSRTPLYIIGGFGGAAKAIFETIVNSGSGKDVLLDACRTVGACAKQEVRLEHGQLIEEVKRPELGFAPEEMVSTFSNLGINGFSEGNGLTVEENERLATSQNVHEILELLVKGLCVL